MSGVTKTLGLSTLSPSSSQLSAALRNFGGSMLGGVERLVKLGELRGAVFGAAVTTVVFTTRKVFNKMRERKEEKLLSLKRKNQAEKLLIDDAEELDTSTKTDLYLGGK